VGCPSWEWTRTGLRTGTVTGASFLFLFVPYGNDITFNTHKNGQEVLASGETNHLGQVKIVSSSKAGKWVWVNAKQFRGILKRGAAHLKWEQTRKKLALRNKLSNKPPLQRCNSNRNKDSGDHVLYNPTSTPLTWSSDLYVQELLNAKRRLEVLEVKGHERDLQIQLLTVEYQDLTENNKGLTKRVKMLQESLLETKAEWQGWKDVGKIKEDFAVEIREGMNSKTTKAEGKTGEQAYTHGMKARDEEKRDFTKKVKTWAQVTGNSAHMEKEIHSQGDDMECRENKERQGRAANIIIKGVREYGKNERTLDLTSEFLKDKLLWQGQIFQAWRAGKPSGKRARPIKVIMSSICDKQTLLGKKKLLRGSRFFLDEDLTIRQQEERREELLKVRAARDEGKRAWLFKGKDVIAFFIPHSKTGQQVGSQEEATISLARKYATRPVWSNRGEDSTLSLVDQNK
jgi:hypothetical protein